MTSSPSAMRPPCPCTVSRTRSAHHGKGSPCPVKPTQPQHIGSASARTCGHLHDTDSCVAQALPDARLHLRSWSQISTDKRTSNPHPPAVSVRYSCA